VLVNRNQADKSSDDEDAETITKKKKPMLAILVDWRRMLYKLASDLLFAIASGLTPLLSNILPLLWILLDPASDEPDELREQAEQYSSLYQDLYTPMWAQSGLENVQVSNATLKY